MSRNSDKAKRSKQPRSITVKELHHLGYAPGDVIRISPGYVSGIHEIIDEQGKQAGFCLLQVRGEVEGVILPLPFGQYLTQHEFDLSEYQEPDVH